MKGQVLDSFGLHAASGTFAWRAFAARFAALVLALSAIVHVWGERALTQVLPLLQTEIAWLDDTYELKSLSLDTEGADRVLRLVVSQRRYIQLAGQLFEPHPQGRANASTLTGHVFLPLVVLAGLVLAWPWPASHWVQWLWRAFKLLPATALLLAVNVPMVLWAGIWRLHVDAFAPMLWSPLLIWADFLQAGGEHVLALGLAMLCLVHRPHSERGQW
jgi:hypothetical protein